MIDIPEARKYCNAYQESHIKGLLSFALDELEAARQRIAELEGRLKANACDDWGNPIILETSDHL